MLFVSACDGEIFFGSLQRAILLLDGSFDKACYHKWTLRLVQL